MTEPISDPKNRAQLYKKIAAVTAAVSRIPKNGRNTFHNYTYATESDITDGLRDLLEQHGLAFLPPSVLNWERDAAAENPKLGPRTRVQVQFGLACADTGEVFTAVLWGEGQDNADKGFYKAYTGAVKYFLMKTFLIATGDDPERDDTPPQQAQRREASYQPARPASAPQKPAQSATANGNGKPTTAAEARDRFFAKYARPAGTTWPMVQAYLNQPQAPEPTTVEGWIAAAEKVRAQMAAAEYDAIEG